MCYINQLEVVFHSQMCTVPYLNAIKVPFPQPPFLGVNFLFTMTVVFFSTRVSVSPFTKRYIVNMRAVDG